MKHWTPPKQNPKAALQCFKDLSLEFVLVAIYTFIVTYLVELFILAPEREDVPTLYQAIHAYSLCAGHIASLVAGYCVLQHIPGPFHRWFTIDLTELELEPVQIETGAFLATLLLAAVSCSLSPDSRPHAGFFFFTLVAFIIRVAIIMSFLIGCRRPPDAGPGWLAEPILDAIKDVWKSNLGSTAMFISILSFSLSLLPSACALAQLMPNAHGFVQLPVILFPFLGGLLICPSVILSVCLRPMARYQAARYRRPAIRPRRPDDNPHNVERGLQNRVLAAHLAARGRSSEVD